MRPSPDLARFHGIVPPILTPLTADEDLDRPSLHRLVAHLIREGVHGIWALGTAGEFASLDETERAEAAETAVEAAAGQVPVIVNIGDCSTRLAIRHARHARDAGADALALTPPYYYPSTMDEMLVHFRDVKQAVPELPLFIYNIPQTVKTKMAPGTVLQLAREGTASGIKDSQNDLRWFRTLVASLRAEGMADSFRLFLGTRILIDAAIVIGAHGAIPAVSNVAARDCVATYEAARQGDYVKSAHHQERVMLVEELGSVARGGSPDAASYASMKTLLAHWRIIDHATLARPLRNLAEAERDDLLRRIDALGEGFQPVAPALAGAAR